MSITELKYFTPKEAQKTLPLVRQIVEDILKAGEKLRTLILEEGKDTAESAESKELLSEINNYIKEIEELGCYYKDWSFSVGLVDFPSVIDGKEVFLCWRSDEHHILFYHYMEEGYSGRKKIPELLLT